LYPESPFAFKNDTNYTPVLAARIARQDFHLRCAYLICDPNPDGTNCPLFCATQNVVPGWNQSGCADLNRRVRIGFSGHDAIRGWDRPQAPGADRPLRCSRRSKSAKSCHSSTARGEHQPGSADIQDLRRAGDRRVREKPTHWRIFETGTERPDRALSVITNGIMGSAITLNASGCVTGLSRRRTTTTKM
jgi:hypothetical protein